jgi:DNA-binding CsgD family transcriptional regulator
LDGAVTGLHVERSSLIERDRELGTAVEALELAVGGEGGHLALVGPAGIGKSALLGSLAEDAASRNVVVLRAFGSELERDFGFGIARQLLEPPLAQADEAEREGLLDGAARLAGPLLGHGAGGDAAGMSLDPSYAALHGLYWLTANLAARSPLLIAVDDVQWADPASLRWLLHLSSRLEGVPALLAVAARVPEPGLDDPLLDALLNQPRAVRLEPAPLSAEGVRALVANGYGSAPDTEFATACHAATAGNPFLAVELVAALRDDGIEPDAKNAELVGSQTPAGISRSAVARIGRLSPPCRPLAAALSVLGGGARLSLVAELAGVERDEATAAADELVGAGIFSDSERLEFVHPIVATAVGSDVPPHTRAQMHRRAAGILADAGAEPGRVAAHLLASEAGSDEWACHQLLAAGGTALAAGAVEQAGAYLERARLEQPDPADPNIAIAILSLLGWVEAIQSREENAIEHLREALSISADAAQRGTIASGLSSALLALRRYVESYEVLERAIADLDGGEVELGLRLEGELGVARGLSREVRRRFDRRARRFEVDPELVVSGLSIGTEALVRALEGGTAAETRELALAALQDGKLVAEQTADSPAIYTVVVALFVSDQLELGHSVCEQAVAEASSRGSQRARSVALCWRGAFNFRLGRIDAAETDLREIPDDILPPLMVPVKLGHLAESLRERGGLAEASELLDAYDLDRRDPGEELLLNFVRFARARVAIDRGELELGLEELRRHRHCEEAWDLPPEGGMQMQWRSVLAAVHRARGERDQAVALAQDDLAIARRYGAARPIGIALTAAGAAEGGDAGAELLAEAAETLAEAGARLEQARALVEHGSLLRREGRRADARGPLREGMALARSCGGVALAERAYDELKATGARPPKILHTGVDALTPSEERVARMAAAGRTNKAIAQELFVTVRTVETHLHNAFKKLDVASRSELPRALGADTEPQ